MKALLVAHHWRSFSRRRSLVHFRCCTAITTSRHHSVKEDTSSLLSKQQTKTSIPWADGHHCCFSSGPSPPSFHDDKEKKEKTSLKKSVPSWKTTTSNALDPSIRGISQVLFVNSPHAGLAILTGLALDNPYVSFLTMTGAVTATIVANNFSQNQPQDSSSLASLKSQSSSWSDGLWSYNGCLIGCVTAVFIAPFPSESIAAAIELADVTTSLGDSLTYVQSCLSSSVAIQTVITGTVITALGSSMTPFVYHQLEQNYSSYKLPQLTLAFNFVAIPMIAMNKIYENGGFQCTFVPNPIIDIALEAPEFIFGLLLNSSLHGVSQIFVQDSMITGACTLFGIGYYSPLLATHTFLGSMFGTMTGAILATGSHGSIATVHDISIGLWSYNSALTSLGIGFFFVHGPQTLLLSTGSATVTALMYGLMSNNVFGLGSIGLPCLTLPFCITMTGCYVLGPKLHKDLCLAVKPQSPERNVKQVKQ